MYGGEADMYGGYILGSSLNINTFSVFQTQGITNSGGSNNKGGLLGVLQNVTSYSKAITSTVRALGNTAGSIRGAGRAIRGR